MPLAAVAAIGAVASAGAGIISSNKAAKAQESAANRAAETEEQQFLLAREDNAPWRAAGTNALAAMQFELGLGARPYFGPGGSIGEDGDIVQPRYADANGNAPVYGQKPEPVAGPAPGSVQARIAELEQITRRNPFLTEDTGEEQRRNELSELSALRSRAAQQPQQNALTEAAKQAPTGTPGQAYQGFQASPGYGFRVAEGQKGVNNRMAAMGLSNSGSLLKATERFRQGIAADEYGTHYNRLAALSGAGQTATQNTAALGANYANAAGNAFMNAGNARAQGAINTGNAISSGINGLSGAFGQFYGAR